jgi:hypothetical protein
MSSSEEEEEYEVAQEKWEDLSRWGKSHSEEWEEDELANNRKLLKYMKK